MIIPWILLPLLVLALWLPGLPPVSFFISSWLAWIPLFWFFKVQTPRIAIRILFFFLTGLIYYSFVLLWLLFYKASVYILILALTAPVFALYFLALYLLTRRFRSPVLETITAMALWTVLMKLYALTPLGNTFFGVPFYGPPEILRIISWIGLPGLGALVIGLCASIVFVLKEKSGSAAVFGLFLLAFFSAGNFFAEKYPQTSPAGPARVALVQHNLPFSGSWRIRHAEDIRQTYSRLAKKAASGHPDLIIFPLYSLPHHFLEELPSLSRATRRWTLAASHVSEKNKSLLPKDTYQNRAFLLSPDGSVADTYQAFQTPFFIVNEKTASEVTILRTPFGNFGVLLCFEDSRASIAEKSVKKGAEFLIALSNPGHFQGTALPYYHVMEDRLRALESGRYVVRLSANGPSVLVDPNGQVLSESAPWTEEILSGEIEKRRGLTFYHRWGFLFDLASGLFLVWVCLRLFLCCQRSDDAIVQTPQ